MLSLRLDRRLPALAIFTAPKLFGFAVAEDLPRHRIELNRVNSAVGDVRQVAEQDAGLAFGDLGSELRFAADRVEEILDVILLKFALRLHEPLFVRIQPPGQFVRLQWRERWFFLCLRLYGDSQVSRDDSCFIVWMPLLPIKNTARLKELRPPAKELKERFD